jgi:hypothetical protein
VRPRTEKDADRERRRSIVRTAAAARARETTRATLTPRATLALRLLQARAPVEPIAEALGVEPTDPALDRFTMDPTAVGPAFTAPLDAAEKARLVGLIRSYRSGHSRA